MSHHFILGNRRIEELIVYHFAHNVLLLCFQNIVCGGRFAVNVNTFSVAANDRRVKRGNVRVYLHLLIQTLGVIVQRLVIVPAVEVVQGNTDQVKSLLGGNMRDKALTGKVGDACLDAVAAFIAPCMR